MFYKQTSCVLTRLRDRKRNCMFIIMRTRNNVTHEHIWQLNSPYEVSTMRTKSRLSQEGGHEFVRIYLMNSSFHGTSSLFVGKSAFLLLELPHGDRLIFLQGHPLQFNFHMDFTLGLQVDLQNTRFCTVTCRKFYILAEILWSTLTSSLMLIGIMCFHNSAKNAGFQNLKKSSK